MTPIRIKRVPSFMKNRLNLSNDYLNHRQTAAAKGKNFQAHKSPSRIGLHQNKTLVIAAVPSGQKQNPNVQIRLLLTLVMSIQ